MFGSISKSNLRHLEVIQNHALRIITGLRMSIPILSLQIEYKFPSVPNNINFIISKTLLKLERVKQLDWPVLSYKVLF